MPQIKLFYIKQYKAIIYFMSNNNKSNYKGNAVSCFNVDFAINDSVNFIRINIVKREE